MGDSHVGVQARLMSQALRKLTSAISKSNCVVIFINQLREKVGVVYGNPEVTPGGRALKFYSSVRIEIRKGETIKVDGEMVGAHTRAKVVKNKVAPPFKTAEFDIMYGKGISKSGEMVDMAVEFDIIKKSGAWFSYGERRLAQGRDNVKALFESDKALATEIEEKVIAELKKKGGAASDEPVQETAPVAAEDTMAVKAVPKVRSRVNLDVDVDD